MQWIVLSSTLLECHHHAVCLHGANAASFVQSHFHVCCKWKSIPENSLADFIAVALALVHSINTVALAFLAIIRKQVFCCCHHVAIFPNSMQKCVWVCVGNILPLAHIFGIATKLGYRDENIKWKFFGSSFFSQWTAKMFAQFHLETTCMCVCVC